MYGNKATNFSVLCDTLNVEQGEPNNNISCRYTKINAKEVTGYVHIDCGTSPDFASTWFPAWNCAWGELICGGTHCELLCGRSNAKGCHELAVYFKEWPPSFSCDGTECGNGPEYFNITSPPTAYEPTAPTTSVPTTSNPTTANPTTDNPTTSAPTTSEPTPNPTTDVPTTSAPTTFSPTTVNPTTAEPTTSIPTAQPTTSIPTTSNPTTFHPTTSVPTTFMPTTSYPTTSHPSHQPSNHPSIPPTIHPTIQPSYIPTVYPTNNPTESPTVDPMMEPTIHPTEIPTVYPTMEPTSNPITEPTTEPTFNPTIQPITANISEIIYITIQIETRLLITETSNITQAIIDIITTQISLKINSTHSLAVDIVSIDKQDNLHTILLEFRIYSHQQTLSKNDISEIITAELEPAIEKEYEGEVIIRDVIVDINDDDTHNMINTAPTDHYWIILIFAAFVSFLGLMVIFIKTLKSNMEKIRKNSTNTNTPLPDGEGDDENSIKYNILISSANMIVAALINEYFLFHHSVDSYIMIVYIMFIILMISYVLKMLYFVYSVCEGVVIIDYKWCSWHTLALLISGDAYNILKFYNENISRFTDHLNIIQVWFVLFMDLFA